jgi:hypothetical protein
VQNYGVVVIVVRAVVSWSSLVIVGCSHGTITTRKNYDTTSNNGKVACNSVYLWFTYVHTVVMAIKILSGVRTLRSEFLLYSTTTKWYSVSSTFE